jgi:ABC-2 type transport system ATP-binding protein
MAIMSPPAPGATIEVRNLTKRFGRVTAVKDLSFSVHPGRITGFLGPNGAGKTTTLRILLDLVNATAGSTTIGGLRYRDIPDPARRVGAVLEATNFHPSRRARAHLRMMAIAAGIPQSRIGDVLELVGLTADARRKVGGYSMGMRQRLQLAGALLGDPDVLILDEPSNGLDPQGIAWLRDFLRHLARQGRTILVSSHLLAEMAQTVDDVVIVSQGQLRVQGPLSVLTSQAQSSMRVRTPELQRLAAIVHQAGFAPRPLTADTMVIDGATPERLGPLIASNQVVVYELVQISQNLESLFLELTTSMSDPPSAAWQQAPPPRVSPPFPPPSPQGPQPFQSPPPFQGGPPPSPQGPQPFQSPPPFQGGPPPPPQSPQPFQGPPPFQGGPPPPPQSPPPPPESVPQP